MRPARLTLENMQSQQQVHGGAQLASYESPADPQTASAAIVANAAASAPDRQMSVTSITLPENFQLPASSANALAGAAAVGQTNKTRPIGQQTLPVQYQQPAAAMQPMYQAVPPPMSNGASMMQPAQPMQQMSSGQVQMGAGAMMQRSIAPAYSQQQQAAPQMWPQQGLHQFPTANGVRTAVSFPTPGTVPLQ